MNSFFDRHVKQLRPATDKKENKTLFSEYLNAKNIVLLGDPGAGKSHLFEKFCESEEGCLVLARNFTKYPKEKFHQKIVYIDGLDEYRSQSTSILDDIVCKLIEATPAKLRISCRVADWLGETDLQAFIPYFDDPKEPIVLVLEKLTSIEIDQVLKIVIPTGDVEEFRNQAKLKGVYPLLSNPQTLLMLADTVREGQWPASKAELYANATQLMVVEKNLAHAQLKKNSFSNDFLLQTAGAICAHLLIANTQGVSTYCVSASDDFPFYGDIFGCNEDSGQLVLSSRLFTVATDTKVQYAHRTIAEYLGAQWLQEKLNQGMSLSRLINMMGHEGYPTSELKGLFAWLATLATEFCSELLKRDPLSILMYGDVANISILHRLELLKELERLAQNDPWFNHDNTGHDFLGGLSCEALAPEFIRILNLPERNFYLRELILNAIGNGPHIPQLDEPLIDVLSDKTAPYMERVAAFSAIKNVCPEGEQTILRVYRDTLVKDPCATRIRAHILEEAYSLGFTPNEVTCLYHDYLDDQHVGSTGELHWFANNFPLADLPAILDGLSTLAPQEYSDEECHGGREVVRSFAAILERYLSVEMPTIDELYRWLKALSLFNQYHYGYDKSSNKPLREWLLASPEIVNELFDIELSEFTDGTSLCLWRCFQELVLYVVNDVDFIKSLSEQCLAGRYSGRIELIVFELCLILSIQLESDCIAVFYNLLDYAEGKEDLLVIVETWNRSKLDDWRGRDSRNAMARTAKETQEYEKRRINFEGAREQIAAGEHFGWIKWIAQVYLGRQNEKTAHYPVERLKLALGSENVEACIQGLLSFNSFECLPSLEELAEANGSSRYYENAFILLAVFDLQFRLENKPAINQFSKELIAKAIAIDCLYIVLNVHGDSGSRHENIWIKDFVKADPDLTIVVYKMIATAELQHKKQHSEGVNKLCQLIAECQASYEALFDLLRDYLNLDSSILLRLLPEFAKQPCTLEKIVCFAENIVMDSKNSLNENFKVWLSFLYLMKPSQTFERIEKLAIQDKEVIWSLKLLKESLNTNHELSNNEVELFGRIILIFGALWENVGFPESGWVGNHPCDAAEFVRKAINSLSAIHNDNATRQLSKLLKMEQLSSYLHNIRHALANQIKVCRESKYQKLNWPQAVETLKGGSPANISDLMSLLLDFLKDIQAEIHYENSDKYKGFWNEDSYGKVTKPKIENSCRSYLLDLLRYKFNSVDVLVELEGYMANGKRADIVLSKGVDMKLPIECKREQHSDLWTAIDQQLIPFYTNDPGAKGHGVYIVFWFGTGKLNKPPNNIPKPHTPVELKAALIEAQSNKLPEDKVEIFVLDVTKSG